TAPGRLRFRGCGGRLDGADPRIRAVVGREAPRLRHVMLTTRYVARTQGLPGSSAVRRPDVIRLPDDFDGIEPILWLVRHDHRGAPDWPAGPVDIDCPG